MATKVKPSRLQVSGTPQVGQVPVYVDEDTFQWGAGGGGGNVKSFTLSSTSDLTTAQEAYDWYDDGNVAIIVYNDKEYLFDYATSGNAYWSVANEEAYDTVSCTGMRKASLQLALSSGTVTGVTALNISVNDFNVLRTDKDYGTPYTPQYNGSPATKKYVDDSVSTLIGLGKFLSLWDATTGQPISFPLSTPYTYNTGDYYLVETISSATPPVNYKPTGSSYTGTASSTTESEELAVGDIYIYDGTNWLLQLNHGKSVSFSEIAGVPNDNSCLCAVLSCKADVSAIPTDNCQLTNGCGYTTCTGTVSTCMDVVCALGYTPYSAGNPCNYINNFAGVISALGYTPYNNTNPCGFTTCTGDISASNAGTTGDVLTKTADGAEWCAPSGGGGLCYVDVLIVGGGGGGGGAGYCCICGTTYCNGGYGGGGGGGGQVVQQYRVPIRCKSTYVTIGTGGTGGAPMANGNNGNNSCFDTITAYGGGGGGRGGYCICLACNGLAGGNGGGGGAGYHCTCTTAACANVQVGGSPNPGGFAGGDSTTCQRSIGKAGGGGGGAGGKGETMTCMGNTSCGWGGNGGKGIINCWLTSAVCYAGGGGGGGGTDGSGALSSMPQCTYAGGGKGGWSGKSKCGCPACAGTANTGGGGGGAFGTYDNNSYPTTCGKGGNGGSGIVLVRYMCDGSYGFCSATGGTICCNGNYRIHKFTGSGNFTIVS